MSEVVEHLKNLNTSVKSANNKKVVFVKNDSDDFVNQQSVVYQQAL